MVKVEDKKGKMVKREGKILIEEERGGGEDGQGEGKRGEKTYEGKAGKWERISKDGEREKKGGKGGLKEWL